MRKVVTPKIRFQVLNRDNFTCQYCGLKAGNGVQLQVDHKISVKDGGDNSINNLNTSCFECNIGKGASSIQKSKKQIYETKISDTIGINIRYFFEWWNTRNLGTIDNNTKVLLKIYISNYMGGENYKNILDYPFFVEKILGRKEGKATDSDLQKLDNEFKKGEEFCDILISMLESPFCTNTGFSENENFENFDLYFEYDLLDDNYWNKDGTCYGDMNKRLNFLLTGSLIDMHEEGDLKNDYTIKKFSYFFNEIKNG